MSEHLQSLNIVWLNGSKQAVTTKTRLFGDKAAKELPSKYKHIRLPDLTSVDWQRARTTRWSADVQMSNIHKRFFATRVPLCHSVQAHFNTKHFLLFKTLIYLHVAFLKRNYAGTDDLATQTALRSTRFEKKIFYDSAVLFFNLWLNARRKLFLIIFSYLGVYSVFLKIRFSTSCSAGFLFGPAVL